MDSPGHSPTAASADRSPFGGSDPDDDPVVHEPRSLFGALDGLGARRASAADPGAFWDKTFTGVSGAPVGGVGGVAHDAAAEHSALLGSSLGDGEGLEMYFADGKRRAERRRAHLERRSSGETFERPGVERGDDGFTPRLPSRDRDDGFHPESLVDGDALRDAAESFAAGARRYGAFPAAAAAATAGPAPESPTVAPMSPFDTMEEELEQSSHVTHGQDQAHALSIAGLNLTQREGARAPTLNDGDLARARAPFGRQSWRLRDEDDDAFAGGSAGFTDSPPERQKDFIDESEMDRDDYGLAAKPSRPFGSIANRKDKLWRLSSSYLANDVPSIQRSLVQHVEYTLARRRYKFDRGSFYQATAHSVRDRLIERWTDTQQFYASRDCKRTYYLSLEFLVGRSMGNAVSNLGLRGAYAEALRQLGYDLEDIMAQEKEPALGNGGLGRLASCFLDTLATLNYPAWGYGLRYKYGMFEQRLLDGKQVEFPDYWLTHGNPWEVERLDVKYLVRLYGHVGTYTDETSGTTRYRWEGGEVIVAVAYDVPVPGHGTYNTNNMRLWSSKPSHEFDLASFNAGDYYGAVEAKERCESITSVLYPSDDNDNGKVLRLKQQFFFVSATLQDALRRYKKRLAPGRTLRQFSKKVAIQLNDTHPSVAIPELMRLLLDEEFLGWEEAWAICTETFGYTNHTILPEALEKWPVPMLEELLPRHMQIIFEINHRFLSEVEARWPGDVQKLKHMSIIEEPCDAQSQKMVRMAHLAVVGSHVVNGVAEIHTALIKTRLFPDFDAMYPGKFLNVTNGVTPRRWILQANPAMSSIFTSVLGPGWVNDLRRLKTLGPFATDPSFQRQWVDAKLANKKRLAGWIAENLSVDVMTDAVFDMQVKRIHEYKRQLMNVLSIVHRYAVIASSSARDRARITPRVCILAGKAAPGYDVAKKIIQLACGVAKVVNNDVRCAGRLQVVFIPNFNVSLAELIIPASDISQHISTAGMEASGTGNMKFVMNGGLIVGTRDGANIEIAREVGEENLFSFGATANEVAALRASMRTRAPSTDERLARVIRMIRSGVFGDPADSAALMDALDPRRDYYLVGHDFPSYLEALDRADLAYANRRGWAAKTIRAASNMWAFSSDRTIKEYAEKVWGVEPSPFKPPHHAQPPARRERATRSAARALGGKRNADEQTSFFFYL